MAINGYGPGSTALLYSNGTASPIGNVDGGYSTALGMNNLGDIVGTALNGDNAYVGFSYIGGNFTDLSPVGIFRAYAINDSDQIVGDIGYYWSQDGALIGTDHGCLYSNGVVKDVGSLGSPRTPTEALGINNAGQVVGYSTANDGLKHAFLYSNSSMQDLGTIEGDATSAVAINNTNQIVGNLQNPYSVNLGSFFYANGR